MSVNDRAVGNPQLFFYFFLVGSQIFLKSGAIVDLNYYKVRSLLRGQSLLKKTKHFWIN